MTIKREYESAVIAHDLVADEAQRQIVDRFERLQREILAQETLPARVLRWWPGSSTAAAPRGVYLWGGVGQGKTFLMDLFYSTLDIEPKKRIHFHRMMSDVHARLKKITDIEDPLDKVAADIAAETAVLCFDEFFVSDIGDAMILGRLLEGLFDRGVILITTSNASPRDLYKEGLQRQRFVPAIEALERNLDVIELDGGIDYRLRLFEQAGTYLAPADEIAHVKLTHYFEEIASGEAVRDHEIDVLGRAIRTRHCAKGIAWFHFMDICDGPRSQEDYIEIARWYPAVIVSDIPILTAELDNPARRFIALVDEFYDRKVKLILSAATGADQLYQGSRLKTEFRRTTSRLTEMQSSAYLHAPHLA